MFSLLGDIYIFIKWSGISTILLVYDWPRRHLLECTSEWVHCQRRLVVYSGFLFLDLGTLDLSSSGCDKKQ